eukprot:1139038-Pelagomonas_calceolata.AAC.2
MQAELGHPELLLYLTTSQGLWNGPATTGNTGLRPVTGLGTTKGGSPTRKRCNTYGRRIGVAVKYFSFYSNRPGHHQKGLSHPEAQQHTWQK